MKSKDIFQKVRNLEIRSKGLVNNLFGGEYQSAFKGRGMAFSEVRPYYFGDDVRLIDWNVTARTGDPYIKIFEEEREQTLMLCVDISPSGLFGSIRQRKMDLATELAAVLAFSAIKNNDKVGLLLFSDCIELYIPPRKGKRHVLRLIRDLYSTEPKGKGTCISTALDYINKVHRKKAIVTLISDMQDKNFEKVLNITNKRHDFICLSIDDELETELPDAGLIPFIDSETGNIQLVDTSDKKIRTAFKAKRLKENDELHKKLTKLHIDHVQLFTNRSYIEPLVNLFQKRHNRY